MKYNNSIFLIFITLVLSGCIGPLYNPYPLSKLSAKVGPPLKLDTMSVEEQINAEIQAENILEANQEEILTTDNTSQSVDQQNKVEEIQNELDIEVLDEKTIVAKWTLDLKENLILPPLEIVQEVSEKCANGNKAQLITFSSSNGLASAKFKCW